MPKFLARDFPLLNNVKLDTRLLGFPANQNPFPDKTSAGRGDMYSSHVPQAMVVNGAEPPGIFAGTELDIGSLDHNLSNRSEDVEVLDFIPKYLSSGQNRGVGSPMYVVVYRGLETGRVGYFRIDRFTSGSDGFGYINKINNLSRFTQKGYRLMKGDKVVQAPNHKETHCAGVNANVVFMTLSETIEDAMLVSKSLVDKLSSTAIYRMVINVRQDVFPIRMYGDPNGEIAQFLPNIGETVKDDGTLCAFRPVSTQTCAADLDPESLHSAQELRDIIYRVPRGAEIIDLDFALARSAMEYGQCPSQYSQIDQYVSMSIEYYRRILAMHAECERNHWPLTPAFSTLVSEAVTYLLSVGQRVPGITTRTTRAEVEGFNGQTVDYIQIVVTYKVTRRANLGGKLTGRDGAKGVICRECPDEEMPIDENGIRADIVIDPASPVKRMNEGQLFEQGLNRISEFVRRRVSDMYQNGTGDTMGAWSTLLEWYGDVNPNYRTIVERVVDTPDEKSKHIKKVVDTFIRLWVPPSLDTITAANMRLWQHKWNVPITRVTFVKTDAQGNKRRFTTEKPIAIGSKYLLLLCKIPHSTSCGAARVSHQGIPIKPGRDAKYTSTVSLTPVKFGEDEIRIMLMDCPAEEVFRLMNHSNSPSGNREVVETLLTTKHPTRISRFKKSNRDLAMSNAILGTFHHYTSVIGMETRQTLTTDMPPPDVMADTDILGIDGSDMSDIEGGWDDDDDSSVVTPVEATTRRKRAKPDDDDDDVEDSGSDDDNASSDDTSDDDASSDDDDSSD